MNTPKTALRYVGAYIPEEKQAALVKLAKSSNRTLAQYSRHLYDAVLAGKIEVPDAVTQSPPQSPRPRKKGARAA